MKPELPASLFPSAPDRPQEQVSTSTQELLIPGSFSSKNQNRGIAEIVPDMLEVEKFGDAGFQEHGIMDAGEFDGL